MNAPISDLAPLLITISEATTITGMSRSAIYLRLASGELTARKAGKRTLIEMASLRAMVNAMPIATIRPHGVRKCS
jgi:hypothetical protein